MTTNTTITAELLDQLLANYEKPEDLTRDDELYQQIKKALIERALAAELTEHLGYEKGDPAGRGRGNSRNGSSAKTVLTEDGEVDIAVPRDRAGTFEPQLIAKGQTHFDGFDEKILSLYARGMTVREIQGHLLELYGTEVSPDHQPGYGRCPRRSARVAEPPARPGLPRRVLRCAAGQNPRRGPGQEQGRLCGVGTQSGWREGRARHLDRA